MSKVDKTIYTFCQPQYPPHGKSISKFLFLFELTWHYEDPSWSPKAELPLPEQNGEPLEPISLTRSGKNFYLPHRNTQWIHLFRGTTTVSDDRNPLGLLYSRVIPWKEPTDHNICRIIVENCRDVIAWKISSCLANKKAGFSNPSITYHYKFHLLHSSKRPDGQLCRVVFLFYRLAVTAVPKIAVQSEACENSLHARARSQGNVPMT